MPFVSDTFNNLEVAMRSPDSFLLCGMLLLTTLFYTALPLIAGETVSSQQLGFRLTVPDGFVQDPGRVKGDVVFAFQRPPAAGQKMNTLILVTRLGGVLGRGKINPKEVTAKKPQITIMTETWKEFDIEVFRVPEQAGDLQLVTFNAQAPLKPEAVQIAVIGEAAREVELRGILRSVLASLEGSTNWLNTDQRVSKFTEGITRLAIMIGVLLILAVGVLAVIIVVVWNAVRKRRFPRGSAGPGATAD